jgi:hypothetical protein
VVEEITSTFQGDDVINDEDDKPPKLSPEVQQQRQRRKQG